jgi:hypothetical protein
VDHDHAARVHTQLVGALDVVQIRVVDVNGLVETGVALLVVQGIATFRGTLIPSRCLCPLGAGPRQSSSASLPCHPSSGSGCNSTSSPPPYRRTEWQNSTRATAPANTAIRLSLSIPLRAFWALLLANHLNAATLWWRASAMIWDRREYSIYREKHICGQQGEMAVNPPCRGPAKGWASSLACNRAPQRRSSRPGRWRRKKNQRAAPPGTLEPVHQPIPGWHHGVRPSQPKKRAPDGAL